MSVNNLLKTDSDEVPLWSNLYVNSLRSKNGIIFDKRAGDIDIYLNTSTGNNANDGLSASTPVLTLEQAIKVLEKFSAEAGVINCAGAARIIPNNTLEDIGNVIDLSGLEGRFSEIQLKGTSIINVPEFTYAGTNAAWGPSPVSFRQLDGLTLSVNPKICHKISETSEEYAHLASNTGTTADLVGGAGIVTGNQIEFISLSSQELFIPSRTTIVGEIRFIIKELIIENDGNNHGLIGNELSYLRGCQLSGNKSIQGQFNLQGCSSKAGASSKPINGSIKANISSFLHNGDIMLFSDTTELRIADFYAIDSAGTLQITYNSDCYISNSLFNNFGIQLTKNSELTTVNLTFAGAYTTHVPIQISYSIAYMDNTAFNNTSDDYNLECIDSGSIAFDGSITSSGTNEFAVIVSGSELTFTNGPGVSINSSANINAIRLLGRSRLNVIGTPGVISSTTDCFVLQSGSTAYFGDDSWGNSGAGTGVVKVGGLAAQTGPLVTQFDSAGELSMLNI